MLLNNLPHFLLQNFSHFPPLKPRCVLWSGASYSPNVAYLVYGGRGQWSGVTGRRSRVAAAAGSRGRQDWGDAAGPGLEGGGVQVVRSKGDRSRVPAVAYYSAREEGTRGSGTLGEESLWLPYLPPSRDWCVPPLTLT